ncbi:MAG: hypothetical protein IJK02_10240 [Clostridia bacterium]|nr:hypothetical protein [Clostridia bacterium]
MENNLKDKITLLVNSCDTYEDLWTPFFTLLKRYWDPGDIRIILNTESKAFSFEGLSVECVHPLDRNDPYGKRMLHVLSQVRTPYVIPLLDDFFLRKEVDLDLICKILQWMDKDPHIVYFNCDCTPTYCALEENVYPGFRRLPVGNEYTLNMQAAVWRTEKLLKYWRPDVSPWEWEEFTNLNAARNKTDKFYCVADPKYAFCDYGYCLKGMGVHHGKWVKEDVVPLFEKEGISVDFSKRGFLEYADHTPAAVGLRSSLKTIKMSSQSIRKWLGKKDALRYACFVKTNPVLRLSRYTPEFLYVKYSLAKEQKKFSKMNDIRQKFFSKRKRG